MSATREARATVPPGSLPTAGSVPGPCGRSRNHDEVLGSSSCSDDGQGAPVPTAAVEARLSCCANRFRTGCQSRKRFRFGHRRCWHHGHLSPRTSGESSSGWDQSDTPMAPPQAAARYACKNGVAAARGILVCIVGGRHEYLPDTAAELRSADGRELGRVAAEMLRDWPGRAALLSSTPTPKHSSWCRFTRAFRDRSIARATSPSSAMRSTRRE